VSASHLEPDAIARVRERVAPVVNFFCNNIHQFHLVRSLARHFDLNLVPEREALAEYAAAGAEALYWPMAANPRTYRPLDVPPRYGATFAGQRYGDRTRLMLALLEAGVDAHAFGQGWEPERAIAAGAAEAQGPLAAFAKLARDAARGRSPWRALEDRRAWARLRSAHAAALHAPLGDEAYVALFSESRVSLGFLVLGDTHRTMRPLRQVRLREFEATMAGAFYLTGWLEELESLYELGREIETYRSRAELVDKCRYYLAHDEARERVRLAGRARARRDHTWERRFESLFAELARRRLLRAEWRP
jgi:spore maturation protein CgeB